MKGFRIIGYTPSKKKLPPGKLSIRWRKASATWIIYVGGRILESGFDSEEEARNYLDRNYNTIIT